MLTRTLTPVVLGLGGAARSFAHTAAVYSGRHVDGSSAGHDYRQFTGLHSRLDLASTGRSLVVTCYQPAAGPYCEASVDGGAWVTLTPSAINAWGATVTVPLGGAGGHTVAIRSKTNGGLFYLEKLANTFQVTGTAPACVADPADAGTQYILAATTADTLGNAGILNNLRLEAGYVSGTAGTYPALVCSVKNLGDDNTYSDYLYGSLFRFKATIGTLDVWTFLGGARFGVYVDGVLRPLVDSPNNQANGWLRVGTGLDTTTEHEYAVCCDMFLASEFNIGGGMAYSIRTTGGTGVNTGTQPALRDKLAGYGDSITDNQTALLTGNGSLQYNTATQGWLMKLGWALGMQYVNLGISSTTVHDFRPFTGWAGSVYGGKYSGKARVDDVTVLSPEAVKAVVLYGTNDYGQVYSGLGAPVETVATFQADFQAMLDALVAGTTATQFYVVGVLPRSDATSVQLAPWRQAQQDAIAANGSARLHYVDPLPWNLDGAGHNDYVTNYLDGLHPNTLGRAIIAAQLAIVMA